MRFTALPKILTVVCLGTALVLTGCGDAIEEKVAEESIEKAMEAGASGGSDADVDIDADSGEVKIESSDGAVAIGNAELPDSFPEDLPLPEGDYEITMASESSADDTVAASLVMTGDIEAIAGHLESGVKSAGYRVEDSMKNQIGEMLQRQLHVSGKGLRLVINVGGTTEDDQVTVQYMIEPSE